MSGLVARLLFMIGIDAILLIAALIGGGMAAWFLLGCCLFLTVFGAVGSLLVVGDMDIDRMIEETSFSSGGALRVSGVVKVPFRFPLAYTLIRDEWVNERNDQAVQGAVLLLPLGKRTLAFSYAIPKLARGIYQLRRVETSAGDLLHLSGYRTVSRVYEADKIIVYPQARHELMDVQDKRKLEDPIFLDGVKEYEEGESARRIDWNSYVRRGRLMTRQSGEEDSRQVCLVLDPGIDEDAFERVVAAAAGFIERNLPLISNGLAIYCGSSLIAEGQRNYFAIMEELAMIKRCAASAFRLSILEAAAAAGQEGAMVIVVGCLDERVMDVISEVRQTHSLSILYASAKLVLSAQERSVVEGLTREGHSFGFVPGPSLLLPVEGVPALG
jgi:uncharacterized protein (DUF58 family)